MSVDRFRVSGNFAISAGAGTGKTYTLSRRYVNCLVGFDLFTEAGAPAPFDAASAESRMNDPYEIITITYTEAGAAEMRRRIEELVSGLLQALNGADADSKLAGIVHQLDDEAKPWLTNRLTACRSGLVHGRIGTIHSFAYEHLRRNADFFNWDASPRLIDAIEQSVMLKRHLNDALAEHEPEARRLFRLVSRDDVFDIAESYVGDAVFRERFEEFSKQGYMAAPMLKLFWRHQLTSHWDDFVCVATELPKLRGIAKNEAAFETHAAMMHDVLAWFAHPLGDGPEYPRMFSVTDESIRKPYYDSFKRLKDIDLDHNTETERRFAEAARILGTILTDTHAAYTAHLRLEAMVDFDSIINACFELVVKQGVMPSVKHLMVDEFQDTNETQWAIIRTIAEKTGAELFLVGDEKQSIYSFQGAEVAVFDRALRQMSIPRTPMTGNFRSRKNIIDFVNTCFDGLFQAAAPKLPLCEDAAMATHLAAMHERLIIRAGLVYDPLQTMRQGDDPGSVTFLAPESDDQRKAADNEYAAVASLVSRIFHGEMPEYAAVTETMRKDRESVAILLQTRKEAAAMSRALMDVGIPATLRTTESIFETPTAIELHHLLATLAALTDADGFSRLPRFHLAGALRGSYLRLTDESVVRIMTEKDFDAVSNLFAPLVPLVDILALPRLVSRIIEHFSVRQVYAAMEDDRQRLADLDKLVRLAHDFAANEGGGLKPFARHLEHAIYAEEPPDEPQEITDTAGRNAVWCMTVHAAKGLQYPMVVLPKIGKNLTQQQATEKVQKVKETVDGDYRSVIGFSVGGESPAARTVAKGFATTQNIDERIRLLYVAMTRAEDHLVMVCPTGNRNRQSYRAYLDRQLNTDLKEMGEDAVFPQDDTSYDTHRFTDSLVAGTRLLSVRPVVPTGPDRAVREIVDITPSALPDFASADTVTAAVREKDAAVHEDAARLGTAFHELVEHFFNELPDDGARKHAAAAIAKAHGLDDEQATRLKAMIDSFAASSLYTDIASAAEVRFELPTAVDLPDGTKGFGRIDVVYGDESGYMVVDFKTTATVDAALTDSYAAQVRLYAESVAHRTGATVTGAVAFVHETEVRVVAVES